MTKVYINVDGLDVEATGDALQEILDFQAQCKAEEDAKLAEAQAKRAAAEAKLAALGLTADDLKALGIS